MSPSPPSSCYGSISSTATAGDIGSPEPSGTVRRKVRPSNTIPVPIPIPNLTKKSRGRRVPTAALLETSARRNISLGAGELGSASSSSGRGNKARIHLCKVPGCGKCFARGEHLKRHIRSIHTYDKPHRCPYPGCGKDFSRHDNLGQHMRVHKDYRSSP
ncbi:hypothetical protein BDP27DRAFT_1496634 [Rhodocollybia butyracea]|uniref:C2H2-type domain-containing protein n=1 Tax=Rhodocollybia butyracea TaxID=206335 RepID=A0A9P5PY27_9AGAR|nr:hypothetical protein BDP27DRAFT_1496634 [Rhodocollybia butyracea]